MELTKKDDWELTDGAVGFEGETENGVRLYVGKSGSFTEDGIIIDLYHQCDRWEISSTTLDVPGKAYSELSDFIKELESIRDYMLTPRFWEICKEVADG